MTESFPNWLRKRMLKGTKGFALDSFILALEGWRRGLTLTWYYDSKEVTNMKNLGSDSFGKVFSLESFDNQNIHYFFRSRGDKVSNDAVAIVQQKHKAKTYFMDEKVPTPKGIMFDKTVEKQVILDRVKSLTYPLVVKPVQGNFGKGVITNIQDETELVQAIDYLITNFEEYNDYIIEEFFEGEEYRVYVIGNEVVAASKRIPANVKGDGIQTIEQLIHEKNKMRKKNPYLAERLIDIDQNIVMHLQKQNFHLSSVPEQNQVIRLKGPANISAGGDPIDATESLTDKVQKVAIAAVKSIPLLVHAGVDVIVHDDDVSVLEVNATSDISMHTFPLEGTPRNVAEKIIDYYFPNSKALAKDRTNIYFDYNDIRKILRDKLAQELTISDAPPSPLYTARYIVSGKVQKVGYRVWIRNQAVKRALHGYTRNLENGNVVVVIGGSNKEEVENFKKVCFRGPAKSKVKRVRKLEWNGPIKLGFEIRKSEKKNDLNL